MSVTGSQRVPIAIVPSIWVLSERVPNIRDATSFATCRLVNGYVHSDRCRPSLLFWGTAHVKKQLLLLTTALGGWSDGKAVTVELNETGPGTSGRHYHPAHSFTLP